MIKSHNRVLGRIGVTLEDGSECWLAKPKIEISFEGSSAIVCCDGVNVLQKRQSEDKNYRDICWDYLIKILEEKYDFYFKLWNQNLEEEEYINKKLKEVD